MLNLCVAFGSDTILHARVIATKSKKYELTGCASLSYEYINEQNKTSRRRVSGDDCGSTERTKNIHMLVTCRIGTARIVIMHMEISDQFTFLTAYAIL